MDSFGLPNVKADKPKALLKYSKFERLNFPFRILELCVFLIICTRFTTHLPAVFKVSGDYFRGLSVIASSPMFVFCIGNAIVVFLFLKSRQIKDGADSNNPIIDLYDDYTKNHDKNRVSFQPEMKKEKTKRVCTAGESFRSDITCAIKETKICRSRSEVFKKAPLHNHKESCRELRRTVTERRQQKSVDFGEEKTMGYFRENEMSNDEFRRTIEAFIARQQRVVREEEDLSSDLCY